MRTIQISLLPFQSKIILKALEDYLKNKIQLSGKKHIKELIQEINELTEKEDKKEDKKFNLERQKDREVKNAKKQQ